MARLVWMVWLMMMTLSVPAGAATPAAPPVPPVPPLYHQVTGGEEECEVPAKASLAILAAERGVKFTVVARHNGLKSPFKLKKGMVLKINTSHIVPAEVENGFVINLPELLLYHFVNGVYQRRYSLAIGKPSWPTPTGTFKIVEKRKNPTWNVPPSIQEEMEEQGQEVLEKVPPGPKNPLGQYFMATSASGVGIHATNRPWSVGSYVSHGCMRMLPQEISELFPQVAIGTPVKIIYRPIKLAVTPEGRIYLEVHPDIYATDFKPMEYLKNLVQQYHLDDRIDWTKVSPILKFKEGIAREITKGPPVPGPVAPPREAAGPREVRLSPLQDKKPRIE